VTDHPNVDLMKRGYAAFAGGDLDTLKELFADDIVWHNPGESIISGDYKGRDEVFAFFGKLVQETGGTFRLDIHDILANDEHAVALARVHAERNGKVEDQNVVHVFHVKDGKVTEFWAMSEDQAAADEVFAP
jgi:ketosteroid isomerase-like protein